MILRLKELPKDAYKYHELHYVYSSQEHYKVTKNADRELFLCEFRREKLENVYRHDSYDTLYNDCWQDCTAYAVLSETSNEEIAYFEISREEWNDRLIITNLLVKEEFRGKGIGTYIVDEVKKIAESENRRIIVLETQSCNVPAIDFYLKNGFVFAGTNMYFYSNLDIEDDEVMIEMVYLY